MRNRSPRRSPVTFPADALAQASGKADGGARKAAKLADDGNGPGAAGAGGAPMLPTPGERIEVHWELNGACRAGLRVPRAPPPPHPTLSARYALPSPEGVARRCAAVADASRGRPFPGMSLRHASTAWPPPDLRV